MEALGMQENTEEQKLKLLSGFPPKALDISDRDKSISSVGIRFGDTIIFQVTSSSTSSSVSSGTSSSSSSNDKVIQDGESQTKRMKTEPPSNPRSKLERK